MSPIQKIFLLAVVAFCIHASASYDITCHENVMSVSHDVGTNGITVGANMDVLPEANTNPRTPNKDFKYADALYEHLALDSNVPVRNMFDEEAEEFDRGGQRRRRGCPPFLRDREFDVAFVSMTAGSENITGGVSLVRHAGATYLVGTFNNVPDGPHGLHIKGIADLSNNCLNTGDHYNPFNKTHSCSAETGHLGDLANVYSVDGIAFVNVSVTGMTLACSNGDEGNGNPGVVGLPLVLDRDRDDCQASTDGDSGPPIACGIIFPAWTPRRHSSSESD